MKGMYEMIEAIGRRYHRTVVLKSLWQAEKGPLQQQFLCKYFDETEHLFASVQEFVA